ncbi:hypothetical protein CYLTODRAFT_403254 [Cylindrobasidium torrendii FP15055 ss-10]|uniref:Uncharacterized protein n=1 Tax=Cylindrobasidium torrendii FP15055 ss-10 TaxID=1314674 RepID=A0A0D7B1M9_9AGAR|nr:hypothetical protein CYLTODRAFT_403254 [Cylindrobasidium torrendii FP15055 ss-10]
MPSVTYPAGVIFKLTNDTPDVVSLQLLRDYTPHPDTTRPNPIVVLVEQMQPLSLVLQPGVTYRYVLRKRDQAADISSVSIPTLISCPLSDRASRTAYGCGTITPGT